MPEPTFCFALGLGSRLERALSFFTTYDTTCWFSSISIVSARFSISLERSDSGFGSISRFMIAPKYEISPPPPPAPWWSSLDIPAVDSATPTVVQVSPAPHRTVFTLQEDHTTAHYRQIRHHRASQINSQSFSSWLEWALVI